MAEPDGPQPGREPLPETANPRGWASPTPVEAPWVASEASPVSVGESSVDPTAADEFSLASSSFALLISAFCCLALLIVAAWLPSGYVIMGPGQVSDTLGKASGVPLITITGHQSYPTTGSLDMTSVSVWGGPGVRIGLLDLLNAWFRGEDVVLPEAQLFPASETAAQADQQFRGDSGGKEHGFSIAVFGRMAQ